MKIGAVIFADPYTHNPDGGNSGWACCYGEEPFAVQGTGDLSTDTYWWMNLSPQSAAVYKILRTPRLLDSSYLRTEMHSIMRELGLSVEPNPDSVQVLSRIFHNVIALARKMFNLDHLPRGSLCGGIAQSLSLFSIEQSAEAEKRIFAATQTYTECQRGKFGSERKFVPCVLDRMEHASHMLSQDLPSGAFNLVTDEQIPMPEISARAKWLIGQNVPVIVEYSIKSIHPLYNSLINYGAGAGLVSGSPHSGSVVALNERQCCCLPELAAMQVISGGIDVHQVWVDTIKPSPKFEFPFSIPSDQLSYSAGLLAENIWVSLGRSAINGRLTRSSPVTAWIHALDRMRCLSKAACAKDAGFDVVNYGYGRIVLALDDSQFEQAIGFAREHKLLLPVGFAPDVNFSIDPNSFSPTDLRLALGITGNLEGILAADDFVTKKILNNYIRTGNEAEG